VVRKTDKSKATFRRAEHVLVGGVNSPVRAFAAVGGTPPIIERARGATITDIDGNTYIDYVGSFGPAILGHAPEHVITAVSKAARKGTSFGATTRSEVLLAEKIASAFESVEKVRFVSSGTEAVMTAVRLARAATGRSKIIKCIGGYHGHSDAMLIHAGSGAATLGVPSCPGVPAGATADTLLVHYNDTQAVAEAFSASQGRIAAVLAEPVAGNMGVIPPADGYLSSLRTICDEHGALLIFDEVITGFRVAPGGAQQLYGVRADLTILGKIIGGGMPVGAVGGPAELMNNLAPVGKVYQAGTLSGNPVTMAAGLASLEALEQEGIYEQLEASSARLAEGLAAAAADAGLADQTCINRVASMLCLFFTAGPVCNYAQATQSNTAAFAAYFQAMLEAGIYLPASQFETVFVSAAHGLQEIDKTVQAAHHALRAAGEVM